MMAYLFNKFDENDIKVIKQQIDSDDVSIAGIIERCKWGFPSLILLYPKREYNGHEAKKVNYKSLSTLIWLTCPFLNNNIHRLESDGYIKKIRDNINNDNGLLSKLQFAHAHFIFLRKRVYRYFLGDVSSLDENNRIFATGIGGVNEVDRIKCLHIHYAHFRIFEESIIGRIVYLLLDKEIYCKERICENDCNKKSDSIYKET